MNTQYYNYIANFECLADKCPNSCCQAWKMQVDDKTFGLYKDKAPELLDSVDLVNMAMKRKPNNFCVRLTDEGLCGIHKQYGSSFLSDACNLYPRIIRESNGVLVGAGSLSCPKVVSDLLSIAEPFAMQSIETERVPSNITRVEHSKLLVQDMLLSKLEDSESAFIFMQKIVFIASMLDSMNIAQWPALVESLIDEIHPELFTKGDSGLGILKVLNTFVIMAKASGKAEDPQIVRMISKVAEIMRLEINWNDLSIAVLDQVAHNDSLVQLISCQDVDIVLKRFLGGQLILTVTSNKAVPGSMREQISILCYKFMLIAVLTKMLQEYDKVTPLHDIAVDIIYVVSRVLDHLADHQLILEVLKSFELDKPEVMIGLLDAFSSDSVTNVR